MQRENQERKTGDWREESRKMVKRKEGEAEDGAGDDEGQRQAKKKNLGPEKRNWKEESETEGGRSETGGSCRRQWVSCEEWRGNQNWVPSHLFG